jgi:hypothetical protein
LSAEKVNDSQHPITGTRQMWKAQRDGWALFIFDLPSFCRRALWPAQPTGSAGLGEWLLSYHRCRQIAFRNQCGAEVSIPNSLLGRLLIHLVGVHVLLLLMKCIAILRPNRKQSALPVLARNIEESVPAFIGIVLSFGRSVPFRSGNAFRCHQRHHSHSRGIQLDQKRLRFDAEVFE